MKLFNIVNSRAARERERERESSLRTSSSLKFKKSFTLIELSIVLLILSLLVGSLLVGRQIVDRAKIQRIIFEFDYYEKAFHQFYDTYRVVPGNMNRKTCLKFSEFNKAKSVDANGTPLGSLCSLGCPEQGGRNAKLLDSNCPQAMFNSTCYTHLAGLTEKKTMCRSNVSCDGWCTCGKTGTYNWQSEGQVYAQGKVGGNQYYAQTSFDSDIQVGYHGFVNLNESNYNRNFMFFNMNNADAYETDDINWKKSVHDHNTIFMLNANLGCPCTSTSQNCSCSKSVGAISAKMTSELDAKIDDGRPGTGRLLAYKNDYVHQNSKPSNAEIEKVCYNKPINQVSSAIYENSSNMRYGCNIIKVMEDVK